MESSFDPVPGGRICNPPTDAVVEQGAVSAPDMPTCGPWFYHLFYNRQTTEGQIQCLVCRSPNPIQFDESSAEEFLAPGPPGAWDSKVVQNPRVFRDGDVWYLLYAGSDRFVDNEGGGLLLSSAGMTPAGCRILRMIHAAFSVIPSSFFSPDT